MIPDIIRMIPSLLQNYVVEVIAVLLLALLFGFASIRSVRALYNLFPRSRILTQVLSFVLMAGLIVIGIRGGTQLRPIRVSNAFLTDNRALGYLTLNSSYSVLQTYFHYTLPDYSFMEDDTARAIVREMLFCSDERLIDPRYPFLRSREAQQTERRLNVVLFIMESWSARDVGAITYVPDGICWS